MKNVILFGLILVLLIPIGSTAERKNEELGVLYSIMKDLGADTKEEDIIFNGVIIDRFIEADEMEAIGKDIVSKIGLIGIEIDPLINEYFDGDSYSKEIIFEDGFGQICYIGQDMEDNKIAIILNSYKNQEELSGETYLYINIIKHSDFLKKNDIIEEVKSIYDMYNCKVEITSCLIGELTGDINYPIMAEEITNSIGRIDGEVVEEFFDTSMMSYSLYTPYIDKYIRIGRDKINLNIAIRNIETENMNYIWIGTPIITVGY